MKEYETNGTIDYLSRVEKYADGINYYMKTHQSQMPLECYLLDYELYPWQVIDSFCIVQEMARQLTWNYNDLYRYINLQALGQTNYTELFGLPQPYQIPIVPDYGSYPESPMEASSESKLY